MKPRTLIFTPDFNQSIRVEADTHHHTTSDAGGIVMRSVLDKTKLLDFLLTGLSDPRDPNRITRPLAELLLQCILMLAQGWGMMSSTQVSADPALTASSRTRRGAGVIGPKSTCASQSTMSRLLSLLSTAKNLAHLNSAVLKLGIEHILSRNEGKRQASCVIDVDSMPVDAHGNQLGSQYNGHYHRRVFLPFFATCGETGDVLGAKLRAGTQNDTRGFKDFVHRIAHAVRTQVADRVIFRLDAGFNGEQVYVPLEEDRMYYLMRLSRNKRLLKMAQVHLQDRTESTVRYVELRYQAEGWSHARRVILVIRPRPDELFDGVYFLITNLEEAQYSGEELANLYSRRGKAEQHQGEMKAAIPQCSLSSSPRPKSHYRQVLIQRQEGEQVQEEPEDKEAVGMENAVRLQLYMLVYQLMHIGRCTLHSTPQTEEPDGAPVQSSELPSGPRVNPEPTVETRTESSANTDTHPDAPVELPPKDASHMHIRTFRLQVLKVGATVVRHGRYLIFRIAQSAVEAWRQFWSHIQKLHWQVVPNF